MSSCSYGAKRIKQTSLLFGKRVKIVSKFLTVPVPLPRREKGDKCELSFEPAAPEPDLDVAYTWR